jgi:hypothetical protein
MGKWLLGIRFKVQLPWKSAVINIQQVVFLSV